MLPYYVIAPIMIAVFLYAFSGVKTVRVFVRWAPTGTGENFDELQTAIGVIGGQKQLPITVTVEQIVPTYM